MQSQGSILRGHALIPGNLTLAGLRMSGFNDWRVSSWCIPSCPPVTIGTPPGIDTWSLSELREHRLEFGITVKKKDLGGHKLAIKMWWRKRGGYAAYMRKVPQSSGVEGDPVQAPPAHNYIKTGPARLVRISPQNISGRAPLKTDPSFRPTDNAIDDVMRRRRAVSLGGARIARALATTRRERKKSCWRRPATRFSITATAGRAPTRFQQLQVYIS